MRIMFLLPAAFALQGCVVGTVVDTAVDIVTLPVDVASKGVDLATTSQKEADRNYGRKVRKAEEEYGRDLREWQRACEKALTRGDDCDDRPSFEMPR
ncbi:hypothetical protein [Sphingomicrobium marinum]|uniref:hypothetical protein n=1 Tax=Sphingomicrobium marinum TaxID=1227950 RepID=UPI0022403374|nr:hypothetical protein [Sphingomicrobium marinum]